MECKHTFQHSHYIDFHPPLGALRISDSPATVAATVNRAQVLRCVYCGKEKTITQQEESKG